MSSIDTQWKSSDVTNIHTCLNLQAATLLRIFMLMQSLPFVTGWVVSKPRKSVGILGNIMLNFMLNRSILHIKMQILVFVLSNHSIIKLFIVCLIQPWISLYCIIRRFFLGMLLFNKNCIRDARTPQPGEIVYNPMRYRSSETVHRLGYFQRSVSVQIIFKQRK